MKDFNINKVDGFNTDLTARVKNETDTVKATSIVRSGIEKKGLLDPGDYKYMVSNLEGGHDDLKKMLATLSPVKDFDEISNNIDMLKIMVSSEDHIELSLAIKEDLSVGSQSSGEVERKENVLIVEKPMDAKAIKTELFTLTGICDEMEESEVIEAMSKIKANVEKLKPDTLENKLVISLFKFAEMMNGASSLYVVDESSFNKQASILNKIATIPTDKNLVIVIGAGSDFSSSGDQQLPEFVKTMGEKGQKVNVVNIALELSDLSSKCTENINVTGIACGIPLKKDQEDSMLLGDLMSEALKGTLDTAKENGFTPVVVDCVSGTPQEYLKTLTLDSSSIFIHDYAGRNNSVIFKPDNSKIETGSSRLNFVPDMLS